MFAKYDYDDRVKEDETDESCSMHGGNENV